MFGLLSRLRNPAIFQGNLGKKKYYEGWYFKQVGLNGAKLAVIPGISLTGGGGHAFVQVFDGYSGESYYFSYLLEDFKPQKEPFEVVIGGNRFSYDGLELDINEEIKIKGSLKFSDMIQFHYSWNERGVMGWYGYMPFMETYHGLLSLDHRVDGSVLVNGEKLEFWEGKGYIEKDWGESFPSAWIWMQSNGFEDLASFMLSTAVIPWLGSSFIGHLTIIRYGGKTINLSTYKGGRITNLEKTEGGVRITVQSRMYKLKVNAIQGKSVHLKSPEKGLMTGRTIESIDSSLEIILFDKKRSKILFSGIGKDAGLEIMDDKDELIKGLKLV